jgi:hypothetical protein
MADVRIQVATYATGALPVDWLVNTVYFRDINLDPSAATDYMNLAVSTRDVFRGRAQAPAGHVVQATAYNMDDPKPRPVKAYAPPLAFTTPNAGGSGAREVALCLSYYSERNLPRNRGRIYIGPFHSIALGLRPAQDHINALGTIATGLANVGGVDVDWSLYSPTTGGLKKITNYWIDNEWDTVRSRGLRATTRTAGTTGE